MNDALRTIIVDDSDENVRLLLQELRRGGYHPDQVSVNKPKALTAAVAEQSWDLILAAGDIPGMGIEDVLKLCRSHHQDIPFIVISDAVGEEKTADLMKAGAHDFVRRDNLNRLLPSIREQLQAAENRQQQRQAQQSLRESEEKYRALVFSSPDAILALNENGVILSFNAAASRMWGRSVDEVLGQSFFESGILHASSRSVAESEFQKTLRGTVCGPYKLTTRHVSGNEVFVEANSMLMKQGLSGARVQMTLRDVTERQKLENQLQLSQKMEAIGQLAGGVAHDFNNQLSGIIGCVEILQVEVAENSELKWFADTIACAAERAADLTRQLLAFARKSKYQTSPIHIHRVIAEVVQLLQHTLDRRINIQQELNADPDLVMGDPSQLQNTILNLAVNARDAMAHGGTLSFVTAVVALDADFCRNLPLHIVPGDYLRISVVDTGKGIDQETMPHIFEPFFTTKPIGAGTGLGLAAVYGAVKSHNGTIQVQSVVDEGTTVNIFLPLEASTQAAVGSGFDAGGQQGSGTILVIDDETIVRSIVERMLARLGYAVVVCEDGKRGIDYFKKQYESIDLVILDMVMPNLSGRETFCELRKISPTVPILIASGHAMSVEIQELLDYGAVEFVQKPFRLRPLSQTVAAALHGS